MRQKKLTTAQWQPCAQLTGFNPIMQLNTNKRHAYFTQTLQ